LKLSHSDLDRIYDFAHKNYIDSDVKECYPIPKLWIYAIKRFLEGKGYEIIIKSKHDITDSDIRLE
jgi:hypothetical protein